MKLRYEMSFDFNPETKEIKLINSKEIVDKKSNADIEEKTENDIELIGNSLKFSDKALDTIGLIIDDRILIKYDKLFGVLRPIIGKEDSFDCKGGNKILKNKTISFRGFQNDMLKEFGNKFNLIAHPTLNGIFALLKDGDRIEQEEKIEFKLPMLNKNKQESNGDDDLFKPLERDKSLLEAAGFELEEDSTNLNDPLSYEL